MTSKTKMNPDLTAFATAAGPPQSEGERSEVADAGGPAAVATIIPKTVSDTEVVAKPRRRQFTAAYKQRILAEADQCTAVGDVGRLLRQEGLYASHLTDWRRARDKGALQALEPNKRGRKPAQHDPLAARIMELERKNSALQEDLRKANLIIAVQKKVAALFDEVDSSARNS